MAKDFDILNCYMFLNKKKVEKNMEDNIVREFLCLVGFAS